jgi:cytochrome P450
LQLCSGLTKVSYSPCTVQVLHVETDSSPGFGIEPRDKVLIKPFGDGIFTKKDMHWKQSRDTIRDQLRRSRYSDLSVFQRTVDNLLRSIRAHGDVVDLQPLFSRMTLDITTEFILGESAKSLVALEGTDSQKFSDAFDIVQKQATAQMRRFNLHWLRDDRYRQAQRDLNHFTDQMIDRSLGLALGGDTETIHSGFLLAIAQETRDRTAIRGQVLHLLVAGRDTTASLLSWTM